MTVPEEPGTRRQVTLKSVSDTGRHESPKRILPLVRSSPDTRCCACMRRPTGKRRVGRRSRRARAGRRRIRWRIGDHVARRFVGRRYGGGIGRGDGWNVGRQRGRQRRLERRYGTRRHDKRRSRRFGLGGRRCRGSGRGTGWGRGGRKRRCLGRFRRRRSLGRWRCGSGGRCRGNEWRGRTRRKLGRGWSRTRWRRSRRERRQPVLGPLRQRRGVHSVDLSVREPRYGRDVSRNHGGDQRIWLQQHHSAPHRAHQ
jgi:hypothetical protein